jgi:hypothetical protein
VAHPSHRAAGTGGGHLRGSLEPATILISDTFIALVSLLLAYLFWAGMMQVWHIYLVIMARAVGGAFHGPAMSASTTLLVPSIAHLEERIARERETVPAS